jgi:hypothetical protein
MNWTVVVYGAPMTLATLWYIIDAHKWFKGPKVSSPITIANVRSTLNIVCWEIQETSSKEKAPTHQKVEV